MDAAQQAAAQLIAGALDNAIQAAIPNLGAAIGGAIAAAPPPAAAPPAAPAAAPPAHMKVRKLTSDTPLDWKLWRQHFELVAQGNNWNERQKRVAIASSIEGKAHTRIAAIENVIDPPGGGNCAPAAALLDQYALRFLPQDLSVARDDFNASYQGEDESIMAWNSRMVFLFTMAYPDADVENDPTSVTHFWKRLNNRKLIESVGQSNPATLNGATQAALRHLQVQDYKNRVGRGQGHNPDLYKKMYAMGEDHVKGEQPSTKRAAVDSSSDEGEGVSAVRGPPTKKRSRRERDSKRESKDKDREVVCWNCGQAGHVKSECRSRQGRSGRGRGNRGRARGRGGRRQGSGGRGGQNRNQMNQIIQATLAAVTALNGPGHASNPDQGNF